MDLEQWDTAQESTLESDEGEATELTEIVISLRHLLAVMGLFAIALFVAGFGWWTVSNMTQSPEAITALQAELAEVRPAAGQAVSRPAEPAVGRARQPADRLALPPIRKGVELKPEAFGVKGNPNAPVTIVEFSDYQ